ncbi:hypothetical protein EMPS_03023 [Entomortierella parvispora]|uniref:COPI associated protein n=1 Tax=Entomortierella parvispora TaxID=205924 RepID=A0A9P3LU48_9FUNG|nr:hypothetical protein EMPS_03023 [Entomortierella parvispora]
MLRLSRRGIILSLFINSLNIVLYLIILLAACLNIAEASVNFIILNGFAAAIACLLIVSEIRLPQLTYEYFRFLCTYRGRGMTYLFFGCLIASRTPFNLYGGIIVVCMGLAFFMLSFVTLIPPLDGFILNYKKLDQWKEQKHFRVRLEAQKIFEQQLQQEQNLARIIPAHHPNALTIHAHMAMGSPKQLRSFGGINSGSTHFVGAGVGANATGIGMGAGASGVHGRSGDGARLKSMHSPPLSPSKRTGNHPFLPKQPLNGGYSQQQQQEQAQDQQHSNQSTPPPPPPPHFPHHQLQSKLQGSLNNFVGPQHPLQNQASMARTSSDYLPLAHGGSESRFSSSQPVVLQTQQAVPDIALTMPTPAEIQPQQARREYFAM